MIITKSFFYNFFLIINFFFNIFILIRIFSIKSEFLPYLVKKQFSSHRRSNHEEHESSTYQNDVKSKSKLFDYFKVDKLAQLISKTSINKRRHDIISCYAFIQADGFSLRANNLAVFAEANRQVPKLMQFFNRERVDSIGRFDRNQVIKLFKYKKSCFTLKAKKLNVLIL